ncbi:MAG: Gfo/Idh/MocA family oxidoreductase [Anaerolineaceae bacterium]|nr:Gfo/Idh/MocA family oxidoreductase [Anaerolineaceae bacterium]
MTNNKVRIGILGTGFGQNHARIYTSFPDVEVVGIAGRDAQKTQAAAQALGVPACTLDELLASPDVDAIDLCLPTRVHPQYAIAALKQGKHVFVETPVAYSMAEATQMAQTAAACQKLLMVALFGRYVSDFKVVHDVVAAGRIGRPKVVFANRRTPPIWGDGWDENFILDLMLHDLDYVYWMLGNPLAVTSRGLPYGEKGWGQVFVALEYDGASAVVEGSGIMPLSFPFSTSLRVVGEEGAIDLSWYWGGEYPISEIKLYPAQGAPEVLQAPRYDPYEAECRHFVDSVLGKAEPGILDMGVACGSLNVALAARASLEQGGKRIEIQLAG